MTVFVLVHGAWSGAHEWRTVSPLLRAAGHEVYAPCLTGLGARRHLASPRTNLSTHVDDVANLLFFEDLTDVVLAGTSYGGMVITGVADRMPDRISHLVYVDAFVPDDGQSVFTIGAPGGTYPAPEPLTEHDFWLIPGDEEDGDAGRDAEPDRAWYAARATAQPKACLSEPVRLALPVEEHPFGRTFVKATADVRPAEGPPGFWPFADRARADLRWRYREIACGHDVAYQQPAELAGLLLEAARS